MKTQVKQQAINVEALLAKKASISSAAIQSAISKMEEQKQKAQEEQVIQHLATIQQATETAVENLRSFRSKEKAAKEYLVAISVAEQAFYTDADWSKYSEASELAQKEYYKAV